MAFEENGISVIVCCYNSANRLAETLRHLALQKVPANISWEIIVINNASTDDTTGTANSAWNSYRRTDVMFHIFDEPVAGLSYAREKGIEKSRYEYLLFCDDDNWLFEDYVENAYNLLGTWQGAGVIGGYGIPKPEGETMLWFNNYSGYYATGFQNNQNGVIGGTNPYVYGAGAVFRKSALKKLKDIHFKPLAVDRLNEKLSSGGDVELCFALKLMGYDIAYSDTLKFYHFIPQSRLSDDYLLQLVYQFGCCNIIHRPYYWLFNPGLPQYRKTWWWTLLISINIYRHSLVNFFKPGDALLKFIGKVNLTHAKGRLTAIIRLNSKIEQSYLLLNKMFLK